MQPHNFCGFSGLVDTKYQLRPNEARGTVAQHSWTWRSQISYRTDTSNH